uniref:F-box domain-containing protein n=1 Tax=Mycena chlorophos TaxID=658473 RepID=A0ABQ0M013_MYCCL|nr:predicted protein [Mycena chlorophos]
MVGRAFPDHHRGLRLRALAYYFGRSAPLEPSAAREDDQPVNYHGNYSFLLTAIFVASMDTLELPDELYSQIISHISSSTPSIPLLWTATRISRSFRRLSILPLLRQTANITVPQFEAGLLLLDTAAGYGNRTSILTKPLFLMAHTCPNGIQHLRIECKRTAYGYSSFSPDRECLRVLDRLMDVLPLLPPIPNITIHRPPTEFSPLQFVLCNPASARARLIVVNARRSRGLLAMCEPAYHNPASRPPDPSPRKPSHRFKRFARRKHSMPNNAPQYTSQGLQHILSQVGTQCFSTSDVRIQIMHGLPDTALVTLQYIDPSRGASFPVLERVPGLSIAAYNAVLEHIISTPSPALPWLVVAKDLQLDFTVLMEFILQQKKLTRLVLRDGCIDDKSLIAPFREPSQENRDVGLPDLPVLEAPAAYFPFISPLLKAATNMTSLVLYFNSGDSFRGTMEALACMPLNCPLSLELRFHTPAFPWVSTEDYTYCRVRVSELIIRLPAAAVARNALGSLPAWVAASFPDIQKLTLRPSERRNIPDFLDDIRGLHPSANLEVVVAGHDELMPLV